MKILKRKDIPGEKEEKKKQLGIVYGISPEYRIISTYQLHGQSIIEQICYLVQLWGHSF